MFDSIRLVFLGVVYKSLSLMDSETLTLNEGIEMSSVQLKASVLKSYVFSSFCL